MAIYFDKRCKKKPFYAYHYDILTKAKKTIGTFETEELASEAYEHYVLSLGIVPEDRGYHEEILHSKKPVNLTFGVWKKEG